MLKFPSHDQRRELYMVVGLAVACLGYSHSLGYWPHGLAMAGVASRAGIPAEGDSASVHWGQLVYSFPLLVLGALYWLGRHRTSAPDSHSPDSLGTAPRPLIECDGRGVMLEGRWAELFDIYNDGPTTATRISFGDVTWIERRTFTLCRAIQEVPSKNRGTACLGFNAENGQRLNDFLHQHPELKPTVTVFFQGPDGKQFCCDYSLCVETGRVIWNPSPVRVA